MRRTKPMNEIKRLMSEYGLTIKALSDKFGIPYRTVQNWHSGTSKCPDYTARMIKELLDHEKKAED